MEVIEFRQINLDDRSDLKYGAWSRVYEYPLVLDMIDKHTSGDISVHNTSWGFEGCHVMFKDDLESKYSEVVNSDKNRSNYPNTITWDITKKPSEDFLERFDVVLNVSTVEEVKYDHMEIIDNLMSQVKAGGLLILTFDLPGMQLDNLVAKLEHKMETFGNNINGEVSILPNPKYKHLTCGLLVIRK